MGFWDEKAYRHSMREIPAESSKRRQHRKAPTVTIDNNVRWNRFAAAREAVYIKGRAETHARNLDNLPSMGDAKTTTSVTDLLAAIDKGFTDSKEFAAALEHLDKIARDDKKQKATTAYAAAVALSATTLRDIHEMRDRHVNIHMAVFPGSMVDLHAIFTGVFLCPPPPGEAGKNPLAYMLLKLGIAFRCWTRKADTVMPKRYKGAGYTNPLRPKESEITAMAEAALTTKVMQAWLLCSLLGNYVHCDPSSRPTLPQRRLLVSALDRRCTTNKNGRTDESIVIVKALMERAPNLHRLATREYIVHLVDSDRSLAAYARSVCNWQQFREHTIRAMDGVRRSVCKWVEQVKNSSGDELFASIAAVRFQRFECSYKKPPMPPLFAITANIGLHAEEKAALERASESDDEEGEGDDYGGGEEDGSIRGGGGGGADTDAIDWGPLLEMVGKGKSERDKQELTEDTGLHVEYCRRMITYTRRLPTAMSQEEFCKDHLPAVLRMCGSPEPAIARVSTMLRNYTGTTKIQWTAQTSALRIAFPHTVQLLTALRAIWQRHGITRDPLPSSYIINQCQAVAERYGTLPRDADAKIVCAPEEATKFAFCEVCREVYTIVHQQRSSLKQVYRDGYRDAQLETKGEFAGRAYCKSSGSFGHERCQDQPLTEISLIGSRIRWFTGETYMMCPGCGQPFEFDPAHNISTERGLVCNECSMNEIDMQFHEGFIDLVDAYTSHEGYKCDFPGCSRVQKSETKVTMFGNLRVCEISKHSRKSCANFMRTNLPSHVLRNPHLPEYDEVIFQAMRQFKAEQAVRTAVQLKATNARHKKQEARDRQTQRR